MFDMKELANEVMQELREELKQQIKEQMIAGIKGVSPNESQQKEISQETGQVTQESKVEEPFDDGVRRQGSGLDIVEKPPTKKARRTGYACPKCWFKWQK